MNRLSKLAIAILASLSLSGSAKDTSKPNITVPSLDGIQKPAQNQMHAPANSNASIEDKIATLDNAANLVDNSQITFSVIHVPLETLLTSTSASCNDINLSDDLNNACSDAISTINNAINQLMSNEPKDTSELLQLFISNNCSNPTSGSILLNLCLSLKNNLSQVKIPAQKATSSSDDNPAPSSTKTEQSHTQDNTTSTLPHESWDAQSLKSSSEANSPPYNNTPDASHSEPSSATDPNAPFAPRFYIPPAKKQ